MPPATLRCCVAPRALARPFWSLNFPRQVAMVDLDIGQINIKGGGDEIALQYLGAAVVLTWQRLPQEVREILLSRSASIKGLPAAHELEAKIKSLIRGHAKPIAGIEQR
jgi:hypothetical protein